MHMHVGIELQYTRAGVGWWLGQLRLPPFVSHASTKNLQQQATAHVFAAI